MAKKTESVRIQDDLYRSVNGEWLDNAVIPADKPATGSFDRLSDDVDKLLMEDFAKFAKGEETPDLPIIEDAVRLISPSVLEPICRLKTGALGSKNPRLHVNEVLIALSISAVTDPNAEAAYACLPDLLGCEAHTSVIVSSTDADTLRKLGVNLTCEPVYESKKLFHR